jgi:hypothetical protein
MPLKVTAVPPVAGPRLGATDDKVGTLLTVT